jgi:1-aminocyclopropane-1-carboxylate deaminase
MEMKPEGRLPSPVDQVSWGGKLNWLVKRDDLIHPLVSGNKYRKLKYILHDFHRGNYRGLISFGGAFSNHIHALAALCGMNGIPSVGIIRGEDDEANPTLSYARSQGMVLHFVSREAYRLKMESERIATILHRYSEYYPVPEGGDHPLAERGVAEIVHELELQGIQPDHLALSAGTGSTATGLIKSLLNKGWPTRVLVLSSLNAPGLRDKIASGSGIDRNDFDYLDYSLGGYARTNPAYLEFLRQFFQKTGIPVDPVYNGKVIFGLDDLQKKGFFKAGASVLWLHTGGLQGLEAYHYMQRKKIGSKGNYL